MKSMRRNLRLLAIALMLLGSTLARSEERGRTFPVKTFPVKGLGVFASNGKMVGEVFDFLPTDGGIVQIALSVDGVLVTLLALRERLLPGGSVQGPSGFLYESTNCSGAPWVFFRESESSLLTPVTWIDNKLYVPDGVGQVVTVRSVSDFLQGTETCYEESPPRQAFLTPNRLLIDLRAEFPPPYTLRGRRVNTEGRKFDQ